MAVLSKLYRFNTLPTKIPAGLFVEIDKQTLKFIWKYRGPRIAKSILNKFGELNISYFQNFVAIKL